MIQNFLLYIRAIMWGNMVRRLREHVLDAQTPISTSINHPDCCYLILGMVFYHVIVCGHALEIGWNLGGNNRRWPLAKGDENREVITGPAMAD